MSSRRRMEVRACLITMFVIPLLLACALGVPQNGPVVLSDTRPTNLDVVVMIDSGKLAPDGTPSLSITYLFQSDKHTVQLTKGETVACGDTPLRNDQSSFDGMLPLPQAGTIIACNYTSGASSAKLSFTVPQGPVFVSPTTGNHVLRATDTNVTYSSADGHSIQIIADNGPSGRVSASNDLEPDNGRYTGLDTSALDAGPGRITLNREYAPQVPVATSFHSASLNILAEATIDVDWV